MGEPGGGFVYYSFEKAGQGVQPKIAYVALIPGTDILVGTGVYVDSIEATRAALSQKIGAEQSR